MKTVKLGDVVEKNSTIKWSDVPKLQEYSYIDLTSVNRSTHIIGETQIINSTNAPSRAQKIVRTSDVIFGTTRPTLNRLCIVNEDYDGQICSTGFCILRAKSSDILPSYIYYLLTTPKFVEYIEKTQRGTSYPAVTDSDVKNFKFALPNIENQRRVVKRLDAAFEKIDRAIELTKKNIQNARTLYYQACAEILRNVRGEESCLNDVCTIDSKLVDPRHEPYSEYIHVGGANIESETGRLINLKTAKEEKLISSKFPFDESVILYSKIRPYLKKVARPDFVGLCSADVYPLSPTSELRKDYLYYLLLSDDFTQYAISGSERAGMPKVNRPHLFAYTFTLPSPSDQDDIIKKLDDISATSSSLATKYQLKVIMLRALKQSLLAQAFSRDKVE